MEREKKFCMSFAGTSKQLVLNKTNMSSLRQIFGDADLEDLPVKQVTLVVREVDFHGESIRHSDYRHETHRRGRLRSERRQRRESLLKPPESEGAGGRDTLCANGFGNTLTTNE